MKRVVLSALLILFVTYTFADENKSKITGLEINRDKEEVNYNYENLRISIKEVWAIRSAIFSNDLNYLMILSGTDVIGTISFYHAKDGKKILTNWYAGKQPSWINNQVYYEAVNWYGDGFSIRSYSQFYNGVKYEGNQFVGDYHGERDYKVDPMCPNYRFEAYKEYSEEVKAFVHYIDYWGKSYSDINILKEIPLSNSKVLSKNDFKKILTLASKIIKDFTDDNSFLYIRLFNHFYIMMEHSVRAKMISIDDFNIYTSQFLDLLKIDASILPWLYKYNISNPGLFALINDNNVRVRSSGGLHGNIIGLLNKGDAVLVLEKGDKKVKIDSMNEYWYKIKRISDNLIGWSYGAYIDIKQ